MTQQLTPSSEFTRQMEYWNIRANETSPEHYYLAQIAYEIACLHSSFITANSKKRASAPKGIESRLIKFVTNGERVNSIKRKKTKSSIEQNKEMNETLDELEKKKKKAFLRHCYMHMNGLLGLAIPLPDHVKD